MINSGDPFARFEQDFNEQLAGIAPADLIPAPTKAKDAEPIPVWNTHPGAEL